MKISPLPTVVLALATLSLPACHDTHGAEHPHDEQKLIVTTPEVKDVIVTQQYVAQIRSQRNIEVRALEEGYLEEITIKEGQAVKAGDVLFKVVPAVYKARLDAELAEAQYAQVELNNAKRLLEQKVISAPEVSLFEAKLAKALAKAAQAQTELNFTIVRAPFDGIVDRLQQMRGSLVGKSDLLTTLSDNSVMWVYFNVPEARYFEFKAREGKGADNSRIKLAESKIELKLADGSTFPQDPGDTVTVEAKFNNETGNIPFRADFPNPDRLLRHGQTGTVRVHRTVHNALVIPQRATFEILDKQYVYVVGEDHIAHQRLITIENELQDTFVIRDGLKATDKIVLEGAREIHEGQKVEYEFEKPEDVLKHQKQDAQ